MGWNAVSPKVHRRRKNGESGFCTLYHWLLSMIVEHQSRLFKSAGHDHSHTRPSYLDNRTASAVRYSW